MQDLNDKITGNELTAAEWNQVPSEIQNVIEALGQTLSGGDLNQLGKGIAGYVANGDFGTDTGAANAYVVGVIGAKQTPTGYTDGMQVSFRVGASNTGASTINAWGLGVKNIFYKGAALTGGELTAGLVVDLRYDFTNGRFDLVPNLSNNLNVSGTFDITNSAGVTLSLRHTSATGSVLVNFYQSTTKVAHVAFQDTNDALQLSSDNGRIEFRAGDVLTNRGYIDPNGGLVWGGPTAGSLGDGTLNVANQIGIGVSVDSGVPFHIESSSIDQIRLQNTSATGSLAISFYQTTTKRAFITFVDTNDDVQIASEYGRISFWTDSAGSEALRGYVDSDGGLVWGAPTGASKGAGTINVENGIYIDNNSVKGMQSGSFTTSSLPSSGGEDTGTFTNNLGTDDVLIVARVEGNSGTQAEKNRIRVFFVFTDGSMVEIGTSEDQAGVNIGAYTVPTTGNIRWVVQNMSTGTAQTATISWAMFAR